MTSYARVSSATWLAVRLAALGRLRQVLVERPDIFNLYELAGEVEAALRATVEARIRLFGSAGKAG